MLGDQSAARKGGGELGAGGHEADVAIEGEDQAEAGRRAVDAGDHRLLHGQDIAAALRELAASPTAGQSPTERVGLAGRGRL